MTLYVGNIPYTLKEEELKEIFQEFGTVTSMKIIADKYTGRSKGFAFVEMKNEEQEDLVVQECNRREIHERNLVVAKAHSKKGYNER
ncbi:MAG TPA: RNA-binding protein [Bacteroides sp.]|nr:RNA-binding protein [Bacteroides sp.]